MIKKTIEQDLLLGLSKKLGVLFEEIAKEFHQQQLPGIPEPVVPPEGEKQFEPHEKTLGRTLPGIERPSQVSTTVHNLKQFQPYLKSAGRKVYPSMGGSLHPKIINLQDGNVMYVFDRNRQSHGKHSKPLASIIFNPTTGKIQGHDVVRLNPQEQQYVFNWLKRNTGNRQQFYPSVIPTNVHEEENHKAHKKDQDTDRQTVDPLNYHGTDPAIRSLLFKAAQEVGPKQNHLETLLAFLSRKEEEHQGMIDNLSAENEQQRAEIKGLIQKIENLVTDIREKEKRFQDFNQQVAQQSDMTVQQQAKAAQAQAQSQTVQQPAAQAVQQPVPVSNVVPMRAKRQQPTAANVAQYRQAAESIQGNIEQALLEGLANHLGDLWEGAFKNIDIDQQEQGHTATFEVGRYKDGFWIPLQHHASQEQAQFHAKSLKKKYPSMEVGIKGQDGQVKLVGLNEFLKEDWNKVNHHDKTNGLSQKAVNAYRREHPGSKLKTAVTTKPSKLKPGSKAAKRRKSFCARMSGNKGPMRKPNGKPTPKALALRRWNCESIEEMARLIQTGEQYITEIKKGVAEEYNGNVKDTELKNVDPDNHSRGEGEFVKNQLHTMKRVITHLDNAIGRGEDLPDWVQSEIAQAVDKIVGVMDYSISSKEQDIEKHHGGSALMKEQAIAIAKHESGKYTKAGQRKK